MAAFVECDGAGSWGFSCQDLVYRVKLCTVSKNFRGWPSTFAVIQY